MIKEFHPDLLPKIRDLAVTAHRDVLNQTLTGNWLSTFRGQGMEFSGYREYQSASDDAGKIDWKASLRAQKLLVKQLDEDRNLQVTLLVDVSNSMLYGSKELLKAEIAAQVASTIAYPAIRAGDSVGLAMFSDEINKFSKPKLGLHQHARITNLLSKPEHYGGGFDLGAALTKSMGALQQRGLLIIISDFIGLEDNWDQHLRVASQRYDLIGVMIRDPRDRRLPKRAGEYVLEDPYTQEKLIIDCAQYAEPYKEYVKQEEQTIFDRFYTSKNDIFSLEAGSDYRKQILTFFARRAAQLQG